jgi:hypothetical protein
MRTDVEGRSVISAFTCRRQEEASETSLRVVDVLDEVGTGNLLNQKSCPSKQLLLSSHPGQKAWRSKRPNTVKDVGAFGSFKPTLSLCFGVRRKRIQNICIRTQYYWSESLSLQTLFTARNSK